MDAAPALETVLQALQALYHGGDGGGKEKASVWLGELQKSVYAWQISDQLLQLNQSMESCYFAAQTMRTKIQYAFHELPASSHQSLRDSLLVHCTKINHETPHAITTQLCLALSDLALQMASWKNSVQELIKQFEGNTQHWTFILELLSLLPEEINSHSLRLGANRRNEVTEELKVASPQLIELLLKVMATATSDIRLQVQVVHCLSSWLCAFAIPLEYLMPSNLLCVPFSALNNKDCPSQLHQVAADCICSALYCAGDFSHDTELTRALFEGIALLIEPYNMAVAMEDLDKCLNYARIFTEMAETLVEIIVKTPHQGYGNFRTLDLLLTCVGHNHYEVADITFSFWNHLSEMLYDLNQQPISDMFKPHIGRLIVALCRHCQYDASMEGLPEEPDDFDDFRLRSAELIRDSVFIVGATDAFYQMYSMLKSDSPAVTWAVSESALFIMMAIARYISPNEENVVPQVVDAILSLSPTVHIMLRFTSLKLIGELKEWIEKHPKYIDQVLQYLYSGLQHNQLATAAAESLQVVCSQCPEQLTSNFGTLLQIVQAVSTSDVSNDVAIGLLKGAAHILSKLNAESIPHGLHQLCAGQVDPLSRLVDMDGVKVVVGNKQCDPSVWLDRLATVFRYTTPSISDEKDHPCRQVILQLWPLLSKAFWKYSNDVRVIERCCRCVRFMVRCLGRNSAELLHPLVQLIVQLYETHPHSCCLYLGSILVDEYGSDVNCIQLLLSMLQALCLPTFKMLEQNNGLKNHPDTVDDLFRLCFRFVQKSPLPFLQCSTIEPLFACAIAGCALDHKEANISVCKFLIEVTKCGRTKSDRPDSETLRQLVSKLIDDRGLQLVNGLMRACLYSLPTYLIPDSADVLYELLMFNRPLVCQWLETSLTSLPLQTSGGAVTATREQLVEFHKSVVSAESAKQVSRALRDFARLYR